MSVAELASECCKRLTCAFCPIEDFCEPIIGGDARSVNCVKVWKNGLKARKKIAILLKIVDISFKICYNKGII